MYKHIILKTRYISWVMGITKTTAKLTFSLTQGHWQSCHLIGHTWFRISLPL